jgi:hypothetical protein
MNARSASYTAIIIGILASALAPATAEAADWNGIMQGQDTLPPVRPQTEYNAQKIDPCEVNPTWGWCLKKKLDELQHGQTPQPHKVGS